MQEAFDVMALTASRRLFPSAMNDLREASSPPPMKAPLESAETAFLENASSMRSWEEFFLGDAYPPKGHYFSFLLDPVQDDVKTEKFAITNPKKI